VRQKELAPSAKVRRTTPEVVRAPPRHLLVRRRCCASKRACARLRRAAEQASCDVRRLDEEAREAAGKAALLRAKESL